MGELWFGGTIYTMEEEGSCVDAIFTENGRIEATGTYERLYHDFEHKIDKEINIEGKTMLPGFIDSHLHMIFHGEQILRLDLSGAESADEVKEAIRHRATDLSPGEWLIGEGWNENQWEDPVIIHKSELDEISPDNPVLLNRVCRHALLANSKAMDLAGITNDTEDPVSGIIVRNENGEATGLFLDDAQLYIKNVMPDESQEYLELVIQTAVKDLVSKGIVGGHTEDLNYHGGSLKTLAAFNKAIHSENKFKAHLLVHHEVIEDILDAGLRFLDGSKYVEIGAMKIFADGAFGGKTAWLRESYEDNPDNYGVPIHTTEELENLVQKARAHHFPVAAHAIGDQAITEVLKTLEKYPLEMGGRDRLIHAVMLREDTLETLKRLPIVCDIQPSFVASDYPWVADRVGEERLKLGYAWKTMLNESIHCAGSSDAPVEDVNPLTGIQDAVLRKSSIDGQVYNADERLSVFQAVQLYTREGAYVIGQEKERGLISPGYQADFTILDEDIFRIEKENIASVDVAQTVIDGEIVYDKNL